MATRTQRSTRLTRGLRLLGAITWGAALANACLLERVRIDPGLDAAGETSLGAAGGTRPEGGFSGKNALAGESGQPGGSGAAGKDAVPDGGQAGVPMSTEGGRSGGGNAGQAPSDGGTAPGDAGQAGGAGAPLAGAGGGSPTDDCDYTESDDLGNDGYYYAGDPEETGLSTASRFTICGRTQIDHYFQPQQSIDIDSYDIDVPQAIEVMVTLDYGEFPEYYVELDINGQGADASYRRVTMPIEHASFSLKLGAGKTLLRVRAHHPSKPTIEHAYKLRVRPDNLEQRCPRASAASADAVYTEKNDGPNSTGNDVYRVTKLNELSAETPSSDGPEYALLASGLHVGHSYLISGVAGDVSQKDDYADGDFYKLNTVDADQITVRLDWDDPAADLDLYVFDVQYAASASAHHASKTGPELLTFSALYPNWIDLWVGGLAAGGQYPVPYTLTICPETFTP